MRLFRRHIVELHALAEGDPTAPEHADRLVAHGWDVDNLLDRELRERLRAQERALISMADDCRTGKTLTSDYLDSLARPLVDSDAPLPTCRFGDGLAMATATRAHPVVRAALVYLHSENVLREADSTERSMIQHEPLLWALASLVLMRANHPPLIADRRLAAAHLFQRASQPQERLVQLVELFCALEITAMRGELSWAALPESSGPVEYSPTLARAIFRRLLDYLRQRAAALSMLLRELDPASLVRVTAGDLTDQERYSGQLDAAANRAMFTRGVSSWWVCLEVESGEAELRLLLAVQEVGALSTGVLAVTADARLVSPDSSEDVLDLASTDCVTLIATDSVDERWPTVAELADEAISRAVDRLTSVIA